MGRPRKEETVDRPSTVNRADRPNRASIHGYRDILGVKGQEEGWHYCWVNDYNVDRWLSYGYDYVTHEVQVGERRINQGTQLGSKVTIPVGNGVIGFLMRIPEELFNEEMKNLEAKNDTLEEQMLRDLNKREDGQYGKVEIKHGRARIN